MRLVSINEFTQMLDPRARQAAEESYMRQCIAQAKLEQDERHHYERMSIEREKIDASAQAVRLQTEAAHKLETLKHDNALGLVSHNHVLGIAGKSSALIDEMAMSVLRQEEEWNRTIVDTFRTIMTKDADLITQERLRKLDQTHLIEKMRLESNLRMAEVILTHELEDHRMVFERRCDIIFRLVERFVGLGPEEVSAETMREWAREAIKKTGMA